jgi:hypothetical protein
MSNIISFRFSSISNISRLRLSVSCKHSILQTGVNVRQAKHLMYWEKCDADTVLTGCSKCNADTIFLMTKGNVMQQSDVRGMQFERIYKFSMLFNNWVYALNVYEMAHF